MPGAGLDTESAKSDNLFNIEIVDGKKNVRVYIMYAYIYILIDREESKSSFANMLTRGGNIIGDD